MRTWAWESPEARKVVLSHIGLRPVIEGVALVIHPNKRAAPIFGADLMALPTRLSVNADVYGTRALTAGVLEPLGESFGRLRSHERAGLGAVESRRASGCTRGRACVMSTTRSPR